MFSFKHEIFWKKVKLTKNWSLNAFLDVILVVNHKIDIFVLCVVLVFQSFPTR